MLKPTLKHFILGLILSLVLLWPKYTQASEPPKLISPEDNKTVADSPKLVWEFSGECIEGGSCFVIEIDNDSNFSSTAKSNYTNSFSYTPQGLANGEWYWRVKAKDKSEKWSEWAGPFKFIISDEPAPSSTPSPTSTSKPSSSPTASPKPESKPAKKENVFEISEVPGEINSDTEFEVNIKLELPDNENKTFYLKGAFKSADKSNYFGQTFYEDRWVLNNAKAVEQYKIETDGSGDWNGKIKIKGDQEDSGFEGTGEYILKVARYSESGSGPTWSNEIKVKINAVEISEEELVLELEEEASEEADWSEDISEPEPSPDYEIKIASVAGIAEIRDNTSLEPETVVLEEKQINWMLVFSGIAVLIGTVGYVVYKIMLRVKG